MRLSSSWGAKARLTEPSLRERAAAFADEVLQRIHAVVPTSKRIVSVKAPDRDLYVVRGEGDTPSDQRVPLLVDGEHLADLSVNFYLVMDRSGRHLKTSQSSFKLYSVLDRTPLVRQEYISGMRSPVPIAHWHFHGERGALSHLLSRAHEVRPNVTPKPHDLSSLHFPVGGERFRPGLEDFLEFLVRECGVDPVTDWERVITEGRAEWRRRQLRTAVRDLQAEAADLLREYGWRVEPPAGDLIEHASPLTQW